MSVCALEARGISIGYPGKEVLSKVDVQIPMGRCVALLGRNALRHNTVAALLKQKFASLRTALSGRGANA